MNPKQERFVAEYVKDLNATQAAIRTGYSARTAYSQGQRLLKHVEVGPAIAAKQAAIGERLEITPQKVLRDLEDARSQAMATEEWGPAIRAAELLGKHIGMFVDRSETVITERNVIRAPEMSETPADWQSTYTPKPH